MTMLSVRPLGFVFGCVVSMVLGTGCRTFEYYGQAVRGQIQVLAKREEVEKLIRNRSTTPELKQKLKLTQKLREFAQTELKLPVDGHYQTYADLGRRYVVWNVTAAPEFSLTAKEWWYPIVGRVSYRGYFSEAAANRYAAQLAARGYDVYVDGVEAYSTLGWFRDPLLNTFIHHDEPDLAAILFHELAHQRLYVKGDTDFNEAFASAVERESVRRWLRGQGNSSAIAEFDASMQREVQFSELVLKARAQLQAVYGKVPRRNKEFPPDEAAQLRRQKSEIIEQLRLDYAALRASWNGYPGYDAWFGRSLNNAQLKSVDTYHRLIPAFEELLREHNGDLAAFYRDVELIGRLRDASRMQRIEALLKKSQSGTSK